MKNYAASSHPPQDLSQLSALFARIRRGEAGLTLGKRASEALAKLVEAPRQTAISSISELAHETGVNASTLTRLTHRLGYKGFHEFQDVFRRSIANERDSSGRGSTGVASEINNSELVALIAAEQIRNISATAERLIANDVDQIVERLMSARELRILGTRQMHGAAVTLAYGLSMLRSGVAMLGAGDDGIPYGIAQLGDGDVIVLLSSSPHPRVMLEWMRIASGQGIIVIAVSDAADRSLARAADYAIVCETGSAPSGVGTTSVIATLDALLGVMARRAGDAGKLEAERREGIVNELEAVAIGR